MKKKILSFVIVLCLTASLFAAPALAVSNDQSTVTAEQIVKALGIMTGDQNGNMNLSNNVSRAEFVKIMVAASHYKDSVSENASNSLFRDVKQDYWAAGYIKVAVDNGWFVGYVDGTFHPNGTITLEESATAVLRLLGYTSTT